MLGLRTCRKDGTSYNGFKWPLEVGAVIEAPDWNDKPICGGGLHFLPWGEGDAQLLSWNADESIALIIEPTDDNVVDIDGRKSKCKSARVMFVGTLQDAAGFIFANGGAGKMICGLTATAGYAGTATAGYAGTATAGDAGTATAGYAGTATAGDAGTATAGDAGTATAGDEGTATAGDKGTATAGDEGILVIGRWNGKCYKLSIAYVGEDGIEANVKYRLDDAGAFVKAK